MRFNIPLVSQFLERFRAVLRRRSRFDFDTEVGRLTRLEQASAFLAVLELRRSGELVLEQAAPFAPIRVLRLEASPAEPTMPGQKTATPSAPLGTTEEKATPDERTPEWNLRSA